MVQLAGKEVGRIGFGLMGKLIPHLPSVYTALTLTRSPGFTWRPNPSPDDQAFEAMREAVAHGSLFWNGGEIYGTPDCNSMTLLERYFARYPEDAEKVVLSIKGAVNLETLAPDASPESLRRSVGNVLTKLNGRKKVDMFECARRDASRPLSETFGILNKEYVETGKIGGISLSEVSAATIHEAVKFTKVAAVEVELSLWSTDPLENGVAAACAEHGIPLVAYSPLSRGVSSPATHYYIIQTKTDSTRIH